MIMLFALTYMLMFSIVWCGSAYCRVEKRGLSHAHILIGQDIDKDRQVSASLIDSFVSAEIRDPIEILNVFLSFEN